MTLVTIRPGVIFRDDAGASFQRMEAEIGTIPCNSTYRSYLAQLAMYNAWTAYVQGRGPYPGHSRAIAPWLSQHCPGLAFDTPDAARVRAIAARHGWVQVADPTEQHHFEYRPELDQYRMQAQPAGNEEETDMPLNEADKAWTREMIRQELAPVVRMIVGAIAGDNLTEADKAWAREMTRQELGGALKSGTEA